jgi:glycine/D-amino acid oxidase-like deaminating enzyme
VADVVVIGAGVIGAAAAYHLARDGHAVTVLDRDTPGMGTTSRGEGNILVSDKHPGPELDLALVSQRRWVEVADELDTDFEWEAKGGLVIASTGPSLTALHGLAAGQRRAGVSAEEVRAHDLHDLEPNLADGLAGGVHYPQDQQVQPVLAAAALLRGALDLGARVMQGTEVTGAVHARDGALTALRTRDGGGPIAADLVVNAAGTWGGELSRMLGGPVPVQPRRGYVLVTEPLPRVVRHKVYSADYVANVASGDAGLETSVVVEGTRGGTVLIGASRERVGFAGGMPVPVVQTLAAQAISLFPMLAGVNLMRVYRGFRPYCPDHLPVIGRDPRVPGLWHACGHEGAGVGLATGTGLLLADLLAGRPPVVDPAPFAPDRFTAEAVA